MGLKYTLVVYRDPQARLGATLTVQRKAAKTDWSAVRLILDRKLQNKY